MNSDRRTTRRRAKESETFQHQQICMRGRPVAELVTTNTNEMDSANSNPIPTTSRGLLNDNDLRAQYPNLFVQRNIPADRVTGASNTELDGTQNQSQPHTGLRQNDGNERGRLEDNGENVEDGEDQDDMSEIHSVIENREEPIPPVNTQLEEMYQDMQRMRTQMQELQDSNRIYSRANEHLKNKNRELEARVADREVRNAQNHASRGTTSNNIRSLLPDTWRILGSQNLSHDLAAATEFRNLAGLNRNAQVDGVRNALAQVNREMHQIDTSRNQSRRNIEGRRPPQQPSFSYQQSNTIPAYDGTAPLGAHAPNASQQGNNRTNNGHASWQGQPFQGSTSQPQGQYQLASVLTTLDPNKEIRSLLKNVEPPTFTGKPDSKSAYDFLLQLEKYQAITSCSTNSLLKGIIPFALKDRAYSWYETEDLVEPFRGWTDFVLRFRRKFQSYDYYEALKRELDNRTQGKNELLSDYISIVIGFFRRLDRVVESEEVIKKILLGLHPTYMTFYREVAQSEDLRSLIQNAQLVDDILERRKNYKPPPTENLVEPGLAYPDQESGSSTQDSRSRRDKYNEFRGQGFRRDRSDSTGSNSNSGFANKVTFRLPAPPDSERDSSTFNSSKIRHDSTDRIVDKGKSKQNDSKGIFKNPSTDEKTQGGTSRSPSPFTSRSRSQSPQGCFECGGDHMIRNCPRRLANPGNERNPGQRRQ
ncbi:unnamed protein product [Orchesella dallaii]|uniref:Retrotransposon gag domain-containing protein n=1 Tax=Orchesella dallaii TaxID=48710 RepID=A0ABP1RST2_9HEXA